MRAIHLGASGLLALSALGVGLGASATMAQGGKDARPADLSVQTLRLVDEHGKEWGFIGRNDQSGDRGLFLRNQAGGIAFELLVAEDAPQMVFRSKSGAWLADLSPRRDGGFALSFSGDAVDAQPVFSNRLKSSIGVSALSPSTSTKDGSKGFIELRDGKDSPILEK
jgi:hypothetical protein